MPHSIPRFLGGFTAWLLLSAAALQAAEQQFELSFPAAVRNEPFTGRVYVIFSKKLNEPRLGPAWFNTEPFVSLDVADWKPDTPLTISAATPGLLAFSKLLVEISLYGFK